jgi:hypothetical protein
MLFRSSRRRRNAPIRFRPRTEALEGRIAPASFVLTTLADNGSVGSLRWAITQSNLTPEADTITIPASIYPSVFEQPVIRLGGSQLPTVNGNTTIVGETVFGVFGERTVRISGDSRSRVFHVGATGNLSLRNVVIAEGSTSGDGGGILNEGILSLNRVTVTNNIAASGGGIASSGPNLTIFDSAITSNAARSRGGGILTSGVFASLVLATISANTVRGADNSNLNTSPTSATNNGGDAEGGGLAILNGLVSIAASTISDNLAVAGQGGPGGNGAAGVAYTSPAGTGLDGGAGNPGGAGARGGNGGIAQGGGIWLDRGSLDFVGSTLSGNRASGGEGGAGGRGGAGGAGQDGGSVDRLTPLVRGGTGGNGGAGGMGGSGGAGGLAFGGGLALGFSAGSLNIVNSTIAGNQAIGGRGGRSGDGGAGGNGGRGGDGASPDDSGYGGNGGNGGNGGATGATGTAYGGGVYFSPSTLGRTAVNATIAFNNVAAGAAAASAGAGGPGGLGGTSLSGSSRFGANGSIGASGAFGLVGGAIGGGLNHIDAAFGTETFRLRLLTSIVAANTANTATASDIDGTLRTPSESASNLIGTGGAGGLVNGQAGNQVGVANPGLRPLGPYGGPTRTVALTSTSPAIDAGDNALASQFNLTTDQRGVGHSRISRGRVDIGAFELQESFVVTTLLDEDDRTTDPGIGQGTSLREAIALANRASTPQTITFAPGLAGTLELTGGQLLIQRDMTIDGPGAKVITINAGGRSRVFEVTDLSAQILNATIRGLSMTGGQAPTGAIGTGGAIFNVENLTLDAVYLYNNTGRYGGAIDSGGPLTIIHSTIANNTAAERGGGISSSTRPVTIINSTIARNSAGSGGGIYVSDGSATLIHVTLANNEAVDSSGGIRLAGGRASLTVQNTICVDPIVADARIAVTQLGGNLIGGNARLGPLADNGGPTPTMALSPGSPAIDAGVNTLAVTAAGTPLTTDQRGLGRISGSAVDLGAYESQRIDIGPAALLAVNEGIAYTRTLTASQPDRQPGWDSLFSGFLLWDQIFFTLTEGSLPAGLALSSGGLLSGTPTEAGTFSFTVAAANLPGSGSQRYTLNVAPRPRPIVDSLADTLDLDYSPGNVSLREAIDLIARGLATGPVTFAPGLAGTITLTRGPLMIASTMTIQGPGAGSLTIDAAGRSRVFEISGGTATEVLLSGLTVTGGSAAVGGGILHGFSRLSLDGVVVAGNSGGGISSNTAALFVSASAIAHNAGVGLQVVEGSTTVLGSTIAYNTGGAFGGGVSMRYGGLLTLINTTIAGNSASRGGGLYVSGDYDGLLAGSFGEVTLRNVTLAGNRASEGAGAYVDFASELWLGNTLIADNNGPQVSIANFQAFVTPEGPNLIEGGLAGFPEVLSDDPQLGPLQDNGGPTMTMALLRGSPAINAGDAALIPSGILVDQRGAGYARIAGAAVDLGAFELQLQPPTITRSLEALHVSEGSFALNSGTFSGAQGNASVTLSASLGSLTRDDAAGTWNWSYLAPDGPAGPTTVTITATDPEGLTATATFRLTISNVAPTVLIHGAPASGRSPEGTTISLTSRVEDPGVLDAAAGFTYAWSVTKDGAPYGSGSAADFSFTPDDNGTYIVTLTATDKDGAISTAAKTTITVDDVPPTIAVSGAARVNAGQTYTLTLGPIRDPGRDAVTRYIVHWGDGSSDTYTTGGDKTHVYTEGGVARDITIDLIDEDGTHLNRGTPLSVSVNAPPVLTLPAPAIGYEDVDLAIPGITVADLDDDTLVVTLSVARGTLTLASTAGLAVTGNGTRVVKLSRGIDLLNAALSTLTYRGKLNVSGSDTLTVTLTDGRLSTSGSVALTIKSAAQQAADLRAKVTALRTAGVLRPWQAELLIVGIDLKWGTPTVNRVRLFLEVVELFGRLGYLPTDQANELLTLGNILLLSVSRR